MNSDGNEVATLIEQARNGSDEAISALIESVRTYLLLVANKEIDPRLRQKVAASDVVQDTCLAISERFETFRGTSEPEFRGWLRQVLLNSLADSRRRYVKSQKRQVSREVVLGDGATLPAQNISPRTSMIANEEAGQLMAAMERLPDDYRQVLQLRNWDLLPFEDIGTRLNRTADAAQKLWTRAVKRLEQELDLK